MKRILFLLALFLVSCTTVPLEKQCVVDSDCVKAECCHASGAVNKEYGPDCSNLFCTQECVPNTLDCGQGQIKCVKNECVGVIN